MLLALTLVVSGMPVGITAEGVNAAEVLESEVLDETEETEGAVENNDAYVEELRPETGDICVFNVSADGKAVGSDGVVYDNVAYLSAETVKTFGAEGQSAYVEICDQIAKEKNAGDYLENAVIAVDEKGNLIVQRKVSMKLLQTLKEELAENAFEDATTVPEKEEGDNVCKDGKTEKLPVQENTEDITADDSLDEEDLHNENANDKNASGEINTEEAVEENAKAEASVENSPAEKEELSAEETMANDATDNNATADDVTDNNAAASDIVSDSETTEDALTETASVEEEELSSGEIPAESMEAGAEDLILSAENMDLIDEPEAEEFEVVENAKADLIIDLGYGKTGDMQQFNSIFPAGSSDDYFYNQLSKSQQSIYNASKVLGKGTTAFTISPSSRPSDIDIYQAVSAYMITEPYKCDWVDTTAPSIVTTYTVKDTGKYVKTTVSFKKSQFYTSAIQKEANAKVLELAAEAQEYAAQNYPEAPVYGIVKYFDKWICENHYYNLINGTLNDNDYGKDKEGNEIIILSDEKKEPYFYCHSSYGVLLKDYGVCESYALAMTRLLDAVGIPNIYATGDALDENGRYSSGHAWNYVGMPDGKWYLQDSTWNEVDVDFPYIISGEPIKVDSPSTEDYLLCADDTNKPNGRIPDGTSWPGLKAFTFEPRSSSKYVPSAEEIILSLKEDTESKPVAELNLLAKKTAILTYDNGKNAYIMNENVPKVWVSSNEKIVKVDKNGKVTAVAPGSAEITLTAAGITAVCKVNVHQINSITFDENGKASLTTSCGISTAEKQNISLTINQKAENPVYTAEQLNQKGVFDGFSVESLSKDIVDVADITLNDNTINFVLTPKKEGKTKINVTFGTKKATLTVSVGKMLDKSWFELKEVEDLVTAGNDGTLKYTGKAFKPKVTLSEVGKAERVKFKVSYLNNKDAGTASVIITGNGKYGGKLEYDFKINPLVLDVDIASIKVTEKSVYSGGTNLTKSTVKHRAANGDKIKLVGLKAGKDYEIEYTNKETGEITRTPSNVGEYTMKIVGKGNYAGTVKVGEKEELPIVPIENKTWKIEQNDIKKAKVKVTVNGKTPTVVVSIGKNILTENTKTVKGDYTVTFYKDKDCTEPATVFAAKTKYFVKIEGVAPNLTNNKPIIKNFKTK